MNTVALSLDTRAKFMKKVRVTPECWIWRGNVSSVGYGRIQTEGARWYAHRLAYTLQHGPIPGGLDVDHMCHNRLCVNVSHLQLVTRKQNLENQSGPHRGNISGVRGVTRRGKRWRVRVTHQGKALSFGHYDDLAEAERVAVDARRSLFTNNLLDFAP